MKSLMLSTSEEGLKVLEISLYQYITDTKYFINKVKSKHKYSEQVKIAENEIKEARILLTQIHHHMKNNNIE